MSKYTKSKLHSYSFLLTLNISHDTGSWMLFWFLIMLQSAKLFPQSHFIMLVIPLFRYGINVFFSLSTFMGEYFCVSTETFNNEIHLEFTRVFFINPEHVSVPEKTYEIRYYYSQIWWCRRMQSFPQIPCCAECNL